MCIRWDVVLILDKAMKKSILCVAILSALCGLPAQGQNHVAEPTVNLGDTSFLDGVAGPGVVIEQIGDIVHDGKIVDPTGKRVPGSSSVNSIGGLTHVAWLTHQRILGGWYGIEVLGAEAYVDAGAQGQGGGFGDMTISPLLLQWPEHRIFGIPIQQRADLDFDVPAGKYSHTSGVNLGSNAFTVHPYYAITAFPTKRMETSWRVHYLWNSENGAPPTGTKAQSTQAGQVIHFNATAAYNFRKGLWGGLNSYYFSQISDGRINGVALHNSPERVGAIGPGVVWNHGHWFFFANEYLELGAQNRATGQKTVLRIEKVF
jgi:hypothetical protein